MLSGQSIARAFQNRNGVRKLRRAVFEALETRQLFNGLLTDVPPMGTFVGYPQIRFDSTVGLNGITPPSVQYDPSTQRFSANAPLVDIDLSADLPADNHVILPVTYPNPSPDPNNDGVLRLTANVSNSGVFHPDAPTFNNLTLAGGIDTNDDFMIEPDEPQGVLLTGNLTAMGFDFTTSGNAYAMNYRFTPTGGILLADFAAEDIGLSMIFHPATPGIPSFSFAFTGTAQGELGPIDTSSVPNLANPVINTLQQPASAVVGSSIADQATVAGGANPTGTVTFNLYDNPNGTGTPLFTDANEPLVNGVAMSSGYTATATNTDYWVATYNGDSNNSSVTSSTAVEPVTITLATPAINTTQQPASAVVGSSIADKATLTGGFNPTGTVTFKLYDNPNGAGTPLATDANEPLVNGVATSVGYIAAATSTDYWVATYNGDSNNVAVTSATAVEPVTITSATPAINTSQQPATAVVGSSIADQATVTGGFSPTGTVTFNLYSNANGTGTPLFTDSNEPLMNGVAASVGYMATATGTDYWVATYNGDTNNNSVTSGTALEPVVITSASTSIVTTASSAVMLGMTAPTLSDSAVVSGGYFETGNLIFTLTGPSGFTPFIQTVPISGNGTYTASDTLPTTGTVAGTYTWSVSYAGDANNKNAVDQGGAAEQTVVNKAQPAIVTTASPAITLGTTAPTLSDSAVVSGGYYETGSLLFTLKGPGGFTYTQTDVITGNGTYTASDTLPSKVAGTYTWSVTYAGDANNKSAVDQGGTAEQTIVSPCPNGTVSGTKYQDIDGSGFLNDATYTGPTVTIELVQGSSVKYSTTTDSHGNYSFANVTPGTYSLVEVVPASWLETAQTSATVTVVAGVASTGYNFADYNEECVLSNFTCIYYVINGTKVVTSLGGNTNQGDEVTVYFTAAPHVTDDLTLVSYLAPEGYYNANDAYKQVIFDDATVHVATGASAQQYHMTVQIPSCDYQIDFICGPAIEQFGNPAGTNPAYLNDFYHAQNRIFDSDNDGLQVCSTVGSTITGIVFCDGNMNGTLDSADQTLAGAVLKLTNSSGQTVGTDVTAANGSYSFENLGPGTYTVTVLTPAVGHIAEPGQPTSFTFTLPNKQSVTNPMGNATKVNFAEISKGLVHGFVWDDCNGDGQVDWNEAGICGVTVTLSGTDCFGNKVSMTCVTDDAGEYLFNNLMPGTYSCTEGQPTGFAEGKNCCGTINGNQCGSLSGSDTICNIQLSGCGDDAINNDFGDKCNTAEGSGAAATAAFWKSSRGQALICSLNGSSSSTALGNWLADMFPQMYGCSGVNLAGMTNSQIASFYVTKDFNVNTTAAKLNTQVLAAAISSYASSSFLSGGTMASAYGFNVTKDGSGYDLINVGTNGAAFGVANNTTISILQALNATNDDAINGVLYSTGETVNGVYYSSSTLQSMATAAYTKINSGTGIS